MKKFFTFLITFFLFFINVNSQDSIDIHKIDPFKYNGGISLVSDYGDFMSQSFEPYKDSYKLEFYEMCDDGDGNYYQDFDKQYSKEGQSLEDFINYWFD